MSTTLLKIQTNTMATNYKRHRGISEQEAASIDRFMANPVWKVIDGNGNEVTAVRYGATVGEIHGMTGVTPALIKTHLKSRHIRPAKRSGCTEYTLYGHCPVTGLPISGFRDSKLNF